MVQKVEHQTSVQHYRSPVAEKKPAAAAAVFAAEAPSAACSPLIANQGLALEIPQMERVAFPVGQPLLQLQPLPPLACRQKDDYRKEEDEIQRYRTDTLKARHVSASQDHPMHEFGT